MECVANIGEEPTAAKAISAMRRGMEAMRETTGIVAMDQNALTRL